MVLIFCGTSVAQQPDPRQIFNEALAAQQRGDEALAVSKYKQLLRSRPDLTAAHANLAGALVALGRFNEAIAEYRTALTEVPGNPALDLNLAVAYFKKGDTASAAGLLSALHTAEPANERVAILLGGCDVRLGLDAQVIALLRPFEAADPDNFDLEFALGSALIAEGRTGDGLQRVEKVAQQGRRAEAYMLATQTYLKLERFNLARQDVEAAMRLNPNLPGLNTVDGRVLDYFGDQKGAVAAYEKAIKSDPNDFQAELQLGAVLYTARQLDAARHHLVCALEMQPTSAPAHYELGRVERAAGQLDAAVKDLEAAEQE
ncbi:MAG: tetratricopeptide repeat protein, partial [Terriglobia bacterium]